jgi:diadenosine tetraphosphate (Ap4A) HIT family hydrolase
MALAACCAIPGLPSNKHISKDYIRSSTKTFMTFVNIGDITWPHCRIVPKDLTGPFGALHQ